MYLKPLSLVVAVSLLALTPSMPLLDSTDGAAHAKSEKAGGGGGGGGGGSGGGKGAEKSGKSDSKSSKAANAGSQAKAKKPVAASAETEPAKAGKGGKEVAGGMTASELGKMSGALNANINAVLAHIRNGQTTKGPVGLLAGLAVADGAAAQASAEAAELKELQGTFDELDQAVADAGYASVDEYLQAKADGTATAEEIAAIDPLIDAVGGTDDTGLALAEDRPSDAEIAEAEAAAAEAAEDVAGAEQAIIDAWNKEGDSGALLTGLRDKLKPHQAEIDAAVAETQETDESAQLQPEEDLAVE